VTISIPTERLILRQWRESDLQPFYELNSNPTVMEFLPAVRNREQSDELAGEIQKRIDENGWGMWAVEEKGSEAFIGFVGLNRPTDELPFNPCIEVGWRLSEEYWGKGYATEAGKKALEIAFHELSLQEVVSFTAVRNKRSEAVMKRLGMFNTKRNFQHPGVSLSDSSSEHILYKITHEQWRRTHI
jgi:ribosomal-protein-alanine N-acetyltransferase